MNFSPEALLIALIKESRGQVLQLRAAMAFIETSAPEPGDERGGMLHLLGVGSPTIENAGMPREVDLEIDSSSVVEHLLSEQRLDFLPSLGVLARLVPPMYGVVQAPVRSEHRLALCFSL